MAEIQDIGYLLNLTEGATTSVDASQPTELVNLRTAQAILANQSNVKDAALAATVGDIDLATGGLLVVDGYQTIAGDRILVKSQTNPIENGIYVAAVGTWLRSADADEDGEIVEGMSIFVRNDGTHTGHGHIYVMNANGPIVIGVDAISFVVHHEVSGHADDVSVDNGSFSILTGTNVQSVLDSADNALQLIADTVDSVVGAGAGAQDLGAFTGSTFSDSGTVKSVLQEAETAIEANAAIYSDSKAVVVSQTNTAGTWTTFTHGLNDAELSSVSFFDEGNSLQNMNSAVLWRPKSGNANAIEVYHSQAKTFKVVYRK
jgi:uncharacterized cupin superfamily protein